MLLPPPSPRLRRQRRGLGRILCVLGPLGYIMIHASPHTRKALLTNPAQKVTGRILCDARLGRILCVCVLTNKQLGGTGEKTQRRPSQTFADLRRPSQADK